MASASMVTVREWYGHRRQPSQVARLRQWSRNRFLPVRRSAPRSRQPIGIASSSAPLTPSMAGSPGGAPYAGSRRRGGSGRPSPCQVNVRRRACVASRRDRRQRRPYASDCGAVPARYSHGRHHCLVSTVRDNSVHWESSQELFLVVHDCISIQFLWQFICDARGLRERP